MSFQADTDAADRFASELAAAGVRLEDLADPNAQAGRIVVEAARPPRLTGNLGATSRADVTANGVTWASTARYWTFVHWGAPRQHVKARPYFVEAVQVSQERLVAVYAAHATDTLKGIRG